jgi:hypothetical protein
MALHLTAEGLRRDAKSVSREVVTPAGAAAATALMSHTIVTNLEGAKRAVVGLGAFGGGVWLAARGKGTYMPYVGVGAALGAAWSLFDKREEHRRRL